ncbi:hypothetical protein A2U01_0064474, partial [Trifolium medium]|nr:hypothetical protein [Trifolium medium]
GLSLTTVPRTIEDLIALRTKGLKGVKLERSSLATGHYARDCKAPSVEPSATATQGGRPTAKGRVYCMSTEVSGQASNAIHEDCQIA